jgi:hypothetical protein
MEPAMPASEPPKKRARRFHYAISLVSAAWIKGIRYENSIRYGTIWHY